MSSKNDHEIRATDGAGLAESACSASIFVAALLKGLVERDDPYFHFGSLLGFAYHRSEAARLGIITSGMKVTSVGFDCYYNWGLKDFSNERVTKWDANVFHLPNVGAQPPRSGPQLSKQHEQEEKRS